MSDLHAQILNLPCKPYDGTDAYTHYCLGHRDARHAAAELASTETERKDAAIAELVSVLQLMLRGIEGGHIKCAPYFDFDPEATEIVFKSTPDLLRETIAKHDTPKAPS